MEGAHDLWIFDRVAAACSKLPNTYFSNLCQPIIIGIILVVSTRISVKNCTFHLLRKRLS